MSTHSRKDFGDAIEKVGDASQARIQQQYLRTIRNIQKKMSGKKIADALATGRGDDVANGSVDIIFRSGAKRITAIDAFPWQLAGLDQGQTAFETMMLGGLGASAAAQTPLLPTTAKVGIDFNLEHPRAVAWAQTRAGELIVDIGNETRAAVRTIIAEGFEGAIDSATVANRIKETVGLTERQAGQVAKFGERLREKRERTPGVVAAKTNAIVERERTVFSNRLKRQRAMSIARTESRAAASAGQAELWEQAGEQGLISKEASTQIWNTSNPDCVICKPMTGQRRKMGEMFTTGIGTSVRRPPDAHPNAVFALSRFVPYGTLHRMVAAPYDDWAVSIRTEYFATTIGPNHPMLTNHGLVKAKDLDVGDFMFCDYRSLCRKESNIFIPHIQDVFCMHKTSGNAYEKITGWHDDFHGDIAKGSAIEVVQPSYALSVWWPSRAIEAAITTDMNCRALGNDSPYCLERIVSIDKTVTFKGTAYDATTSAGLYCSDGFVVSNCVCWLSMEFRR